MCLKSFIFALLFGAYVFYSLMVYTRGTDHALHYTRAELAAIRQGKDLFQQYNCIACHQLYGLGGYLGPELTTAWSDPSRGESYLKAFLQNGGVRMPQFHFTDQEVDALIRYLRYVDSTAVTYKTRIHE
jgi:nitric oxide reductase subunit C